MKKKFNLNSLKVKSFITDLEKGNVETINGGGLGRRRTSGNLPEHTETCLATIIEPGCRSHNIYFCSGL